MSRPRVSGLVRWFRRPWVAWTWISVPLLILALINVPGPGMAIGPWLWCYLNLAVVFLVARTKTFSWRFAALTFTAGVPPAVLIGLTEVMLANLLGVGLYDQAGAVLIAGPLEETLKLLPVLTLLAFTRRRAAGFSAVDLLIIGFATGAAFQAVEDGMRYLGRTVPDVVGPGVVPGSGEPMSGYPQYGLEWLTGWSANHVGTFAGHAVGPALVAVAIGLAMRSRRPVMWVAPSALYLLVVLDHSMYNATLYDASPLLIPGWVYSAWDMLGNGGLQAPLLTLLLVVAMVADSRVVRLARPVVPPIPDLPVPRAIRNAATRADFTIRRLFPADAAPVFHRLAGLMAATFAGSLHLLAQIVHDLALTLQAARRERSPAAEATAPSSPPSGRPLVTAPGTGPPAAAPAVRAAPAGRSRAGRMPYSTPAPDRPPVERTDPPGPRWFAAMFYLRMRRRLAFEADRYDRRPRRHLTAAALVIVLLLGVTAIAALGTLPMHDLGPWWLGLSPQQRAFAVAGLAGLLVLGGLGFWTPGAVGMPAAAHGKVTFLRNPAAATWGFFTGLTPQRLTGYGFALVLGRILPEDRDEGSAAHLRRAIDDAAADPAGRLRHRRKIIEAYWTDRGAVRAEDLLGTGRRDHPDFQFPAKPGQVPPGRVLLDLEPGTINEVIDADPGGLSVSERLLQDDYRRNLTGPDGRELIGEALRRRLEELRAEGVGMVADGGPPPHGRYAGQRVFLKDSQLRERYPDGLYVNLYGHPCL